MSRLQNLQAAIAQLDSALKGVNTSAPISEEDAQALDALLPAIWEKLPDSSLSIVITGERANRFSSAIYQMFDAATSLASMTGRFPAHSGVRPGDIDPHLAVEGFTDSITKRASLMLSMIEGEEQSEEK